MYKIGIIGDRATVAGFIALGYTVCEADDAAAAREALRRLGDDESYAIIFIVEKFARELGGEMNRYASRQTPAVTVLPEKGGDGMSYGMELIKRHVEKAVGADILFRD